jgi:hypothetical protein
MEFIERIVSISPDNGSGSLELSIILAVVVSITAVVWARRTHHPRNR